MLNYSVNNVKIPESKEYSEDPDLVASILITAVADRKQNEEAREMGEEEEKRLQEEERKLNEEERKLQQEERRLQEQRQHELELARLQFQTMTAGQSETQGSKWR
ncbi:hypothetical protein AVEN_272781-1 [Araneus ventricosus]|uniref:Uncharacterized protein n=1 Tax=Araneus ventricosus TaxID=182803 RepID=A0A4Y2VAF0_ARAVE|nr:hypothetical protein AVEN_272781-1 [Araneus ventricosus]